MRLVTYEPKLFEALRRGAQRMNVPGLCHQPFVDYYYASRESCRLHLFFDDDDNVAGTVGVERVRFEYDGAPLELGFGSNFHAWQKGAGGLLFLQWMKSCPIGAVFGGSPMTHHIIESRKWAYFGGVKTYFLNRAFEASRGEAWQRRAAKLLLRATVRRVNLARRVARLSESVGKRLSVREEASFHEDLLPARSPFRFRCAPDAAYLDWRYNTRLSFVRYRVFRLLADGRSAGYVILNESAKRLIVAQCDGENAADLAHGIVMSVAAASREDRRPREVLLTSSHAAMQAVFHSFGFTTRGHDRAFALGTLRRPIELDSDTANWLINYDWTDNGLRAPFLDQLSFATRFPER